MSSRYTFKRLVYNATSLVCGILFCIGVLASIVCWSFADNGYIYPVASIAGTVLFLLATVATRRMKHTWMKRDAIYNDAKALAEYIRENRSGEIQVRTVLHESFIKRLRHGDDNVIIKDARSLMATRESGQISEEQYRSKVDELIRLALGNKNDS